MTNRQSALKIVKKLRNNDFEAFFAGGCVRDMLIRRTAKDYDVVTNAHPDEVSKLFKRTIEVGARFGVVMVIAGPKPVEVATFRTESGYADGRHPSHVEFSNAKDDASRRDFTINGMFYDPLNKKIIDFVHGRKDLQKKIIRTIGNPKERFGEDYLRMLRAIRFSTQLNFTIVPNTWQAITKHAPKIKKISNERIAAELEAILTNPNRASGARLLVNSRLAKAIFPNLTKKQTDHAIKVLSRLPQKTDYPLALAALFAALETYPAMKLFQHLKPSNAHKKHLKFLLANRTKLLNPDIPLAKFKLLLAEPYFHDLYAFQYAIQKANNETTTPLKAVKKRAHDLVGKQLTPKPLLDGRQLISIGVKPGQMVGLAKEEMYIAQLSEIIKTQKQAKKWVQNWLKKHAPLNR